MVESNNALRTNCPVLPQEVHVPVCLEMGISGQFRDLLHPTGRATQGHTSPRGTCFIRGAGGSTVLGQCGPARLLVTWRQVLDPVECTVGFGPCFRVILFGLWAGGHCGYLPVFGAGLGFVWFLQQQVTIPDDGRDLALAWLLFLFPDSLAVAEVLLQFSG